MSLPYFQFYTGKYLKHAAHLSLLEHGVYFRVLCTQWVTVGCKMPAEDGWIARRIMARTDEEIAALEIVLDEFFVTERGKVFNKPLLEQFNDTVKKSQNYSKNGKKGGRPAKSLKNNPKKKAIVKPSISHTDTDTDTDIKDKSFIVPANAEPKKTRRRKTPLPPDWRPEPLSPEMHNELQMTHQELKAEYDKFKDHAAAGGRQQIDWQAAWRNWLRSPYRSQGQGTSSVGGSTSTGNRPQSKGLAGAVERAALRRAEAQDPSYIEIPPSLDGGDERLSLSYDDDAD